MSETVFARLPERGVITVDGADARSFLQGIVSNDMNKIAVDRAGYGAFLTPQGKYLFDFFMVMQDETLLIETERGRIGDFIKRLTLYKLRAKADLADASDEFAVFAVFGGNAADAIGLAGERGAAAAYRDGVAFVDPRLSAAGGRVILPADSPAKTFADLKAATADDYDRHRLALGLPDGSRDLIVDKSTLMESGFDELGGIDWQKGCYMGQEVTARTKHRGLVKKRLLPVTVEGGAPEPGTPVMADGRAVGEIRSSNGERALALLRLDPLESGAEMSAGDRPLAAHRPDWAAY